MSGILDVMPIIDDKNIFGGTDDLNFLITYVTDNEPYQLSLKYAVEKTIEFTSFDGTQLERYELLNDLLNKWIIVRSIAQSSVTNTDVNYKLDEIVGLLNIKLSNLRSLLEVESETIGASASASHAMPLSFDDIDRKIMELNSETDEEEIITKGIGYKQQLHDLMTSHEKKPISAFLPARNFEGFCTFIENSSVIENSFVVETMLNSGTSGKLMKASLSKDKIELLKSVGIELTEGYYVLKVIQNTAHISKLKHEIKVHQILSKKHGMKFYACMELRDNKLIYILEYIDGIDFLDFMDLIDNNPLSGKILLKLLINIGNEIKYLSDRSIAHRDLKPENIMITKNRERRVVLVDYEYSCIKGKVGHCAPGTFGTRGYIDPFQSETGFNMIAGDWYAYTMMLLYSFYGINLRTYDETKIERGLNTPSDKLEDWTYIQHEINKLKKEKNPFNDTMVSIFESVLNPGIAQADRMPYNEIMTRLTSLYSSIR